MIWHHGMLSTKYELLSSQTEAFSSEVHSSSSWVQMIWRSNRSFFPVTLETVWGSKLTGHMRSSLSNFHLFVFKRATSYGSNLISTERALREGFQEKVAVFFYFVQITSTPPSPPSPQFGQLVPLFLNANVPKKLGRGLPLPPHPQIDPIYTVCEKWTKILGRALPPPHLDKIQKNSYFFSGDRP